jgi:hypothetical protein
MGEIFYRLASQMNKNIPGKTTVVFRHQFIFEINILLSVPIGINFVHWHKLTNSVISKFKDSEEKELKFQTIIQGAPSIAVYEAA